MQHRNDLFRLASPLCLQTNGIIIRTVGIRIKTITQEYSGGKEHVSWDRH